MEAALFALFGALAIFSSAFVVLQRNLRIAWLGLLTTLAATAVLFLLLSSAFVALLQILLFSALTFGLFLASKRVSVTRRPIHPRGRRLPAGVSAALASLTFATLLGALFGRGEASARMVMTLPERVSTRALTESLFSGYTLVLGMAVLLVLVAAVAIQILLRSPENDSQ